MHNNNKITKSAMKEHFVISQCVANDVPIKCISAHVGGCVVANATSKGKPSRASNND